MKITKEHIGRDVFGKSAIVCRVLAADEIKVWLKVGSAYFVENADDEWHLVDPVKKPSERIAEKLSGRLFLSHEVQNLRESADYANARIDLLIQYLDEQAEKSK